MDTFIQIVFFIIAALILGAALMTVTARNLIHAALWLISCFLSVGALYLLMEAEFAAIAQVLAYVGAIAVLILFAIMVTPNIDLAEQAIFKNRWVAMLVAAALFGLLIVPTMLAHGWSPQPATATVANAQVLGAALMREYLLPFELASVLLLVALIGAIVIGMDVGLHRRVLTLADEVRLRREASERASEPAQLPDQADAPAEQPLVVGEERSSNA